MLRHDTRLLLTTDEAARILGVTDRHVRRLLAHNRINGYCIGGRWLIPPDEVLHYARTRGWCNRYGTKGGSRCA